MILKKKIPNDFYKLFRTKNREAYMQFVTAIYEENNEVYASLGLTQEECALIIENTIEKSKIVWQEEDDMEEGETPDALFPSDSPSGMLNHMIRWGWLKSDFDEKLNTCVDLLSRNTASCMSSCLKSCRVMMTAGKERACFLFTVRCLPIILTMRKTMIF